MRFAGLTASYRAHREQHMDLLDCLNRVTDQESFLDFARALVGFLESAIAWAEDSSFGEKTKEIDNPWRKFARFLYASKIYE